MALTGLWVVLGMALVTVVAMLAYPAAALADRYADVEGTATWVATAYTVFVLFITGILEAAIGLLGAL